MEKEGLLTIFLAAILTRNFVFIKFLGICPYVGVSKKLSSAVGMGSAVTFVMVMAGTVTYLFYELFLVPQHLEFLRTILFILVIATFVQFVEMVIRKHAPDLYRALGIYLPLITTNCAVLGVSVLNINEGLSLPQAIAQSLGAGLGFTLALVIRAGIRERLELADVPESLKGFPITFITAAIIAMAFLTLNGLI